MDRIFGRTTLEIQFMTSTHIGTELRRLYRTLYYVL
jgi:hypothetical protein